MSRNANSLEKDVKEFADMLGTDVDPHYEGASPAGLGRHDSLTKEREVIPLLDSDAKEIPTIPTEDMFKKEVEDSLKTMTLSVSDDNLLQLSHGNFKPAGTQTEYSFDRKLLQEYTREAKRVYEEVFGSDTEIKAVSDQFENVWNYDNIFQYSNVGPEIKPRTRPGKRDPPMLRFFKGFSKKVDDLQVGNSLYFCMNTTKGTHWSVCRLQRHPNDAEGGSVVCCELIDSFKEDQARHYLNLICADKQQKEGNMFLPHLKTWMGMVEKKTLLKPCFRPNRLSAVQVNCDCAYFSLGNIMCDLYGIRPIKDFVKHENVQFWRHLVALQMVAGTKFPVLKQVMEKLLEHHKQTISRSPSSKTQQADGKQKRKKKNARKVRKTPNPPKKKKKKLTRNR